MIALVDAWGRARPAKTEAAHATDRHAAWVVAIAISLALVIALAWGLARLRRRADAERADRELDARFEELDRRAGADRARGPRCGRR